MNGRHVLPAQLLSDASFFAAVWTGAIGVAILYLVRGLRTYRPPLPGDERA